MRRVSFEGPIKAGRKHLVGALVVVGREADLLEVVRAAHTSGRLTDLLDGGQQQTNQDRDDGDHHQEFDQREPDAGSPSTGTSHVRTSSMVQLRGERTGSYPN